MKIPVVAGKQNFSATECLDDDSDDDDSNRCTKKKRDKLKREQPIDDHTQRYK